MPSIASRVPASSILAEGRAPAPPRGRPRRRRRRSPPRPRAAPPSAAGRSRPAARRRAARPRSRAGSARAGPTWSAIWARSANQAGGSISVDLDVGAAGDLLGDLRPQRLEAPRAATCTDVGQRERDRVRVLLEDGAVDVARRRCGRGPGRRRRRRRRRRRSRSPAGAPIRSAWALRTMSSVTRVATSAAHRLVVERRGGAVGELVGVEEGVVGVAGDQRPEQRQRRQDRRAPAPRSCRVPSLMRPQPIGGPRWRPRSASLTSAGLLRASARHSARRRAIRTPRGLDRRRRGGRPARFRLDPPLSARRAARFRARRSPAGRRWSSPPTTSAPATSPARSAPTWRRAGSATTPRAAPATSRTSRRRRTSSACGSGRSTRSPPSPAPGRRAAGRRRQRGRPRRGGARRLAAPGGLRPSPRRGGRPRRRRRAAGRGRLRAHRAGRGARPVRDPRRHPRRLPGDRGAGRAAGAVRRRDRVDPLVLDLHPALARRGGADRARPGRRARARAPRAGRVSRARTESARTSPSSCRSTRSARRST